LIIACRIKKKSTLTLNIYVAATVEKTYFTGGGIVHCGPCNNEHYLGHVKNVNDDNDNVHGPRFYLISVLIGYNCSS